jgi:predicted SnoaL-like aldol condensation-catalyzing enzyme
VSPDKYIQPNPNGKDGRESFINGFAKYVESTAYKCEFQRVVAELELVVVHSHCKEKPDDRGSAVVDIFRVERGPIVEHCDVVQAIPESPRTRTRCSNWVTCTWIPGDDANPGFARAAVSG